MTTTATLPPRGEGLDLKGLILAKERELGELEEYRVSQLEKYGKEREAALQATKLQLAKLTEDFRFNLSLIEERDAELLSFETEIVTLREGIRERETELSALRVELEEERRQKSLALSSAEEREAYYAGKLRESREETEALRYKIVETQRLAKEREAAMQTECTTRVREALETSESARNDLAAALDQASARLEVEKRAASEQAEQEIQAAHSRAEAADRKVALAVKAAADAEAAQDAAEQRAAESSRQLQRERWEREDAQRRAADREKQLEERISALRAAARLNDDETQARINQVKAECDAEILKTRRELEQEKHQAIDEQKAFFHNILEERKEKEKNDLDELKERITLQYEHNALLKSQETTQAAEIATRAALQAQQASLRDSFEAKFSAAKAAWALEVNALQIKYDHTVDCLRAARTEVQKLKTDNVQFKMHTAAAHDSVVAELATVRAEFRQRELRITELETELAETRGQLKALRDTPPMLDTHAHTNMNNQTSPLFSDDNGAASPFSIADASAITYKDEALRLRSVVASMRADLEGLQAEFAKAETERAAEIHSLKRREADALAARRNASAAVAQRLDTLETDLADTTRKLHSTIIQNKALVKANKEFQQQLHRHSENKKSSSSKGSRGGRHKREEQIPYDDDESVADDEEEEQEERNQEPPLQRAVPTPAKKKKTASLDQIRAQLRQRGQSSTIPIVSKPQSSTTLSRKSSSRSAATVRNYNQTTDEE